MPDPNDLPLPPADVPDPSPSEKPKEDEEEAILVCLPVAGSAAISASLVKNSRKERCDDCNSRVWVSPASWEIVQKRQLKVICIPCAKKRSKDDQDDDLNIESPTEEQLAELRGALNRDFSAEQLQDLRQRAQDELREDDWSDIRAAAEKGYSKELWDKLQASARKEAPTPEELADFLKALRKRLTERN